MNRPWPDPGPNENVMIVLYQQPLDYPEHCVLRAQYASADGVKPHALAILFPSLKDAARYMMWNYPDKVWMPRHPEDEAQIVGAWI